MVARRHYWIAGSALVLLCAVAVAVAWTILCPVCHLGVLRPPEAVASRGDIEPSKNLTIWNGSYHGPPYEDYPKICTRCWMAYHSGLHFWQRASEVPDAFYRPLSAAIRFVPLPAAEHIHYRVVYNEEYTDAQFHESVGFWCDDLAEVIEPLRAYAAAHNLSFEVDAPPRQKGQQFVRIETKPQTI